MPQDEQQPVKVVADYHQWINDCRVLALKEYWQRLKEVNDARDSRVCASRDGANSRDDGANAHQHATQEKEHTSGEYHDFNGES